MLSIDAALTPLLPIVSGLPENLPTLAAEIHADNIRYGWWKQEIEWDEGGCIVGVTTLPRDIGELLALIHSEISEADEGVRDDLDDDKLPHRKMVEVEMADAAIRILDVLGYHRSRGTIMNLPESMRCWDWREWLAMMHRYVSRALEAFRKGNRDEGCRRLWDVLAIIDQAAVYFDLDLSGAIAEKRAFNAQRLDHKLENRGVVGGKQF